MTARSRLGRSSGTVTLPLWLVAGGGGFLGFLAVVLWSLKRRRRHPLRFTVEPGIERLERTIAGLTQGSLCADNHVELVENGAFFDRLLADVAAARHSVHLETFLAKEGEVTERVSDALAARARAGVTVRVMLDANGSRNFGRAGLCRMRDAGVAVEHFRPLRLRNLGRLNNRDHRKIAVIDGRLGWVGGHCLTDHWLGDGEDEDHYRDLSARVQGPVVAQLQAAFAEHWIEETGEAFGGEACFPELAAQGDASAHVVWVSPAGAPSCVELLHRLAIEAATRSITIQNPYFLPDPEDRRALVRAARRGVAVRVMMPATGASDAPFVQRASHHHFGDLLAAGVEIYEYERTLLHQKVMTVDGVWSTIGSSNFDDRSFEINDEVMLAVTGVDLARQLEEIFARDLAHAGRMRLTDWRRRPWHRRLVDFSLYLVNEQL